ncbi:efflux RND transporter periplasmic adaptor subunit [Yoonia sp.]|uniref:efflux RND transporter periplasmic adaptor subunit n=1 Tax=Yoonia sp. TaxID=2212373 RepID=UPI0019DA41A9|nr:efflux RND transporter periplasmic adaptor subunit [Yoonia sp.]MBE0414601.1 efflux RND transporter periplasmic adaptor subunit [Yoonia sp.]
MKIFPVITALVVCVTLYFTVFQRDLLFKFAGATPTEETASDNADNAAPDATESLEGVRVVAMRSAAQTIDSAVILRGQTQAAREVTVAAETSGAVISEPLRKGAFVDAGDELCQLDPGTRQASLAEARARLAEAVSREPEAEAGVIEAAARIREAEVNLNAARRLSQDGFASETRLVSAEATMESAQAGLQRANSAVASARAGIQSAEAAVATAEREIERLHIIAPFAGLLETDTAELGTLMQPGSPCATIIQLNPIKLVGFVPETEVSKVTVGAMAGARLTNGLQVRGQVSFVSRSADDLTRTFRVEVTVPNADLGISDGQTAEIIVASDGRTAHLLAQSSLTLDDNGVLGVRTITPEKSVAFMPVTLLRDTADGVWVTDLPDVVEIITIGHEFVTDGVRVNPTYTEAKG